MKNYRNHLLLGVLLLFGHIASAKEIIVTSTGDTGYGTFRNSLIIAANNPGPDTIFIDVKGTIFCETPLTIDDDDLTIIGPYAKHLNITSSGGFIGPLLTITNSSNIFLKAVGFLDGPHIGASILVENANGDIKIERCLFNGNFYTGENGTVRIQNPTNISAICTVIACGFVGNTADQGGAIYIDGMDCDIANNTFGNNTASVANGGAIYLNVDQGETKIRHNTFKFNVSSTSTGDALFVATGGNAYLHNNLFESNNVPSTNTVANSGAFTSMGGNVVKQNVGGDSGGLPWVGSDDLGTFTITGSAGILKTDGYGMMYYQQFFGFVVDFGVPTPGTWLSLMDDGRLAPRVLHGGSAPSADAGAIEYTPFTVNVDDDNPTTFNSLAWCLDPLNAPSSGPTYIEFDFGYVPTFNPSAGDFDIGGTTIIDGFTSPQSSIPGPQIDFVDGVTPGVPAAVIFDSGSATNGFNLFGSSQDSRISGLAIYAFDGYAIRMNGDNNLIQGNLIGVDEFGGVMANGGGGVLMEGTNSMIGGYEHWTRNVVSANGTGAGGTNIYVTSIASDNNIHGNFIGITPFGDNSGLALPTDNGIVVEGNNTRIGDIGYGNRNVISGNNQSGIELILGSMNTEIYNNYIGTDYEGTDAVSNTRGVYTQGGNGCTIGDYSNSRRNIISANTLANVFIGDLGSPLVVNNYIGPDSSGNTTPGSVSYLSQFGVVVNGPVSGSNVQIGDPTVNGGNLISGNQTGINVENISFSSLVRIQFNYIGFTKDGTGDLGNRDFGIHVLPTFPSIADIEIGAGVANIIGWTNDAGGTGDGVGLQIDGNGTDDQHIINSNIIGMNFDGTVAAPNRTGIRLNDCINTEIGNDYGGGENNWISGNSGYGIEVRGGCSNVHIRGNVVGLDGGGTFSIANQLGGILVTEGAYATTIGGIADERNVISGNLAGGAQSGIFCDGPGAGGGGETVISDNIIGLDFVGNDPVPNFRGISVVDDHTAIIGGGAGDENYVSGNSEAGIYIASSGAFTDGNIIGLDLNLDPDGNTDGIIMDAPATVGGALTNRIAGNLDNGIRINSGAGGSILDNNIIGSDGFSGDAIENQGNGIYIDNAPAVTVGNPIGSGNIIAGNLQDGVRIEGPGASANSLNNNVFYDVGDVDNVNNIGVHILGGATGNNIGFQYSVDGNTIASCINEGILIEDSDFTNIFGNAIGTDGTSGTISNNIGIKLENANGTTIGGENPSFGVDYNVISANDSCGVLIDGASSGTGIYGNLIGLDEVGTNGLGNLHGIIITGGSGSNNIGAVLPNNQNYISGNIEEGIHINSAANNIASNIIGLDTSGLSVPGGFGQLYGIHLTPNGSGTLIGGNAGDEGSYITNNTVAGLWIESESNEVYGNTFGLNVSDLDIGTQDIGIEIFGTQANDNIIGWSSDSGNVFMNNDTWGILIWNGPIDNTIAGNNIGASDLGAVFGTQEVGVGLFGAGDGNIVGSNAAGLGNVISRNTVGVQIDSTSNTLVMNNQIGTFIGIGSAPNLESGVEIFNYSTSNVVGGGGPFTLNTISANVNQNVWISGPATTDNDISGNIIGLALDSTGIAASGYGVLIDDGASNNYVGKASTGNTIGAASVAGVEIDNANLNYVQGNWIGPLGSNFDGVVVRNGASYNLIGGIASERNIISGNDNFGIFIDDADTNTINGNWIGTNLFGGDTLPNLEGIHMVNGEYNRIGDVTTAKVNVIVGNTDYGIYMDNCKFDTIQNNYLGTNWNGTDTTNFNDTDYGIFAFGCSDSYIGGDKTIGEGNIISNHDIAGIELDGSTDFQIHGNLIGTNWNGVEYFGNSSAGITLVNNSNNNTIGAPTGLGNLITDNGTTGIMINGSDNNSVQNNYIGTSVLGFGVTPADRQENGVTIITDSDNNQIGGISSSEGNVISGHNVAGVVLFDVDNNIVEGNNIGLTAPGNDSLPNQVGIYMENCGGNRIGDPFLGEHNVISSNWDAGIYLLNCNGDTIQNNFFGTQMNTIDTLPNTACAGGIYAETSTGLYIGGDRGASEGNVFVNHDTTGIHFDGTTLSWIYGNNIGLNLSGTTQGNDQLGIGLENGSNGNTIGQAVANYNNIITANFGGILIEGSNDNDISANFIGTDVTGTAVPTDQQFEGIGLSLGASNNEIKDGNIISANINSAIKIVDPGTNNNLVLANYIGLDESGMNPLGNGEGVYIANGAQFNEIGGPGGGRNVIAANTTASVSIWDSGTQNNLVAGNLIGMNQDSSLVIGGTIYGIGALDDANNNIFGEPVPGGGNRICGVDSCAIFLGFGSYKNSVFNNTVGLVPGGIDPTATITAVFIEDSDSNQIGGVFPFEKNEFANCDHGVEMEMASTGNSILGNSMRSFTFFGIDINGDEVAEPIDSLVDAAGNNYALDKPELLSAYACRPGENTRVGYRVSVPTGFDYVMEFFISDSTAGYFGAGDTLVGRDTISVTTLSQMHNSELDLELSDLVHITATITKVDGSTSEFSNNLSPIPPPPFLATSLPITTTDSVYCPGDVVADLNVGAFGVEWYDIFPTSVIGTGTPFVPTLTPGRNIIYAAATTDNGCTTAPDSILIILQDTSNMYAIPDEDICLNATVQLDAFGGATYLWDANPDLSDINIANPTATPSFASTYTVTITDSIGCIKSDDVRVDFLPTDSCAIETYTAFTPNGDGTNDTWWIDGIEGYPENTVYIYNRWGDRINRIPNYDNVNNFWDGTKGGGGNAITGTYYYVVDVGDSDLNFAGWVQLLR